MLDSTALRRFVGIDLGRERVRDGLGLHGIVQHDLLDAALLDHLSLRRRADGVRQQPLAAFFSDPLAPAHQAGRVARHVVTEVALAAEVLPVRVLDPTRSYVLVALGVDVLEVQQCGHQPRGQRGPPRGRDELRAPLPAERLPVDQHTQPREFVALVDQIDQFGSE